MSRDTQGYDADETEAEVNDTTIYRDATIRHLPDLLNALPVHVLNCEAPDCGVCRVWESIVRERSEQADTRRADEAHYRRQEEVNTQREWNDD